VEDDQRADGKVELLRPYRLSVTIRRHARQNWPLGRGCPTNSSETELAYEARRKNRRSPRILLPASVVVLSRGRRRRDDAWEGNEVLMKTIMVRYKTSEAHAPTNEALVRAVFEELRARAPGGIRYTAYRLEDGVTFVHLATLESEDGNPLTVLPAFKAFQKRIQERCVEPPVVTELSAIGSY
jgi:hypothetical protein